MEPTRGPWRLGPDCDILAGDVVVLRDLNARVADLVLAASAPDLARENAALRKSQAANESELRQADETIGALRKRVEELEQAHAVCLSVHKDVESCLAAEERTEKAERERDAALESLASYQAASHNYVRCYELNRHLQADLDTALDWIEHDEEESIPPAGLWQRVKALLEKRRVDRG